MRAARHLLAAAAALASLVVVVPVGLVVLPLWAVAALARSVARLLELRVLEWPDLIAFEEEIGWKPRPNVSGSVTDLNGDPFHLTTDERGWRKAGRFEESDLVVLGDSYAFGFGVDDDDFFARRVPGQRVSSIGAPGYGMVQPVMWIERLAGELGGKTVVWMVYVGNDFIETILPASDDHRAPFVAVRGDGSCEVVTRHVRPDPWPFPTRYGMDAYIDVCSPGAVSTRAFAAAGYLVGRAARACRSAGARLVVMTVPDLSPAAREALDRALEARSRPGSFDEDLPERRMAEICAEHGVPLVALRDHLGAEHYLARDFHWSASGHGRVADVLAEIARRPEGAWPGAAGGRAGKHGSARDDRAATGTVGAAAAGDAA